MQRTERDRLPVLATALLLLLAAAARSHAAPPPLFRGRIGDTWRDSRPAWIPGAFAASTGPRL